MVHQFLSILARLIRMVDYSLNQSYFLLDSHEIHIRAIDLAVIDTASNFKSISETRLDSFLCALSNDEIE